MANECNYCGLRHIETNMLVLNGGELWVEFCNHCGDKHVLRNAENGEILLIRELWARVAAQAANAPYIRDPNDIAMAAEIARREDAMAEEEAIRDAYEYEYWKDWEARQEAARIERAQLAIDHWDNHIYRCEHSARYTCPRYVLAA